MLTILCTAVWYRLDLLYTRVQSF